MFERLIPIVTIILFINAGFMILPKVNPDSTTGLDSQGVIPMNNGIFAGMNDENVFMKYSNTDELWSGRNPIDANALQKNVSLNSSACGGEGCDDTGGLEGFIGGAISLLLGNPLIAGVTTAVTSTGSILGFIYNLVFGFGTVLKAMGLPNAIVFFISLPINILISLVVFESVLSIVRALRGASPI